MGDITEVEARFLNTMSKSSVRIASALEGISKALQDLVKAAKSEARPQSGNRNGSNRKDC